MPRENLGELEHRVLLAILRLGGEAYSVPIVVELDQRTGSRVAPAAVYIALRRLEKKGLLSSRKADAPEAEGGRERRYFRLQEQGRARLRESRRSLLSLWDGVAEELDT